MSISSSDPCQFRRSLIAARFKMTSAVVTLPNGQVLIGGDSKYVEVFEPQKNGFGAASGGMDEARMYATATVLLDGRVLLAGGYDHDMAVTSRSWVYEPSDNKEKLVSISTRTLSLTNRSC